MIMYTAARRAPLFGCQETDAGKNLWKTMMSIEHPCHTLEDHNKCPRRMDPASIWQIRPLTIQDSARRMLLTSCEYLCAWAQEPPGDSAGGADSV